jgi:hypothetical protein
LKHIKSSKDSDYELSQDDEEGVDESSDDDNFIIRLQEKAP